MVVHYCYVEVHCDGFVGRALCLKLMHCNAGEVDFLLLWTPSLSIVVLLLLSGCEIDWDLG